VSEVFSAKADLLLARLAAACPPGPTATAAADCAPSNASVPSAVRAGSAAGPEVGAVCGGAAAAAALGVVPGEAIDIQDVFYRFTLDAFCHIGAFAAARSRPGGHVWGSRRGANAAAGVWQRPERGVNLLRGPAPLCVSLHA
jgi:hypothetical protein